MTGPITPVTMPKWGIEMTEGTINEWNFAVGQTVKRGDALLEVETEKIVNSVEAPAAGVLRRILADKGDTRPVGSLIAVFAPAEVGDPEVDAFVASFKGATVSFEPGANDDTPESAAAATSNVAGAAGAATTAAAAQSQSDGGAGDGGEVRISPIARRLAERLGVDLSQVQGTGRNGRISKEDVEAHAARTAAAGGANVAGAAAGTAGTAAGTVGAASGAAGGAAVSGESGGPAIRAGNEPKRVRLSNMRATIARRLLESTQSIPHYRVAVDVGMDRLLARKAAASGGAARATLNDLLIHAVARALAQHPNVNAQLAGDEILEYAHADIAVAVATANGLVTPIIRDGDSKSVEAIATEARDLAERAARGALTRDEITGGTFTVSNLGMLGVDRFDAIINPPQVAILAVGAVAEHVVARDGKPAIERRATLTLSADHRVVDGAAAARFLASLRALVESGGEPA